MSGDVVVSSPPPDELLALALSRPREALATARALLSGSVPDAVAAVAHQAAGIVLRDFGDIAEALREFRAGIRRARRAGDDERTADIRAAYGVALVLSGQPAAGLEQIDVAAAGASGLAAGRIQIRKAHALWVLGRNTEMLRAAQAAVSLLSLTGDLAWQARAFEHRAMAGLALGAVNRADADYARAERLFEQAGQHLEYASTRHDRAIVVFARGDLPRALALLDDAQVVIEGLGVFEPELYFTRVQVLLAAELSRDALHVADAAVARSIRQHGSAARRSELVFAAAQAASAAGDHAVAVARSREAARMFSRQQRPWWSARAQLVLLQGRFASGDSSVRLGQAAALLAQELGRIDPGRAGEAHLLAGRVALRRGDRELAADQLRAAASGRSTDLRARLTGWLARAELAADEGRSRDMLAACTRGLRLVQAHLDTLGATELRARATGLGSELAALALRHAQQTDSARLVLTWAERWRAISLTAAPVRLSGDSQLSRDLAALRALVQRLESGEPTTALLHERRRLEEAVRRQALSRPASGTSQSGRTVMRALRDSLGAAELVELTDIDGVLFAVHLQPGRAPALHRVGPTAAADHALARALFALRRVGGRRVPAQLDIELIGARLQDALLGPVAARIHAPEVVVVPTGRLHAVPWALLPVFGDRALTVAPSAEFWIRGRRATAGSDRRIVLIGGPGLAGGAQEIRRLAQRYPQAEVLADGTATSERVLAAMDGAWLVHVAAHGVFRADSPLLSSLLLDDGPLTVYDLERLQRAPHRIVLSSCDSAVGAPSGADELIGVASALMSLGSAGVVASVVPVNDPATVPFMMALHQLLPDVAVGEAVAGARRSVFADPAARIVAQSFIALGR